MFPHITLATTLAIAATLNSALAYNLTTPETHIPFSYKMSDCYFNSTGFATYGNGHSTGFEFCATQWAPANGNRVIKQIKTWSSRTKVWGLELHFTNNKFMRMPKDGITNIGAPGVVLYESVLQFNPSNTTVTGAYTTSTTTNNIDGFHISMTDGQQLSVGNTANMDGPLYWHQERLVGLSGHFGQNGLESIWFHTMQLNSSSP
jgi:hypothetical protein